MGVHSIINNKVKVTVGALILTFAFILWEYFNGGVITHQLLASEDLPGISNWWGLLTVPLLSWITISLTKKNQDNKVTSKRKYEDQEARIQKHLLVSFLFGAIVSLLWEYGLESILQYFILFPVLIALFIPVHQPANLLGFVIGMLFTFGGVLPIIIGIVLLTMAFVVNKSIQFLKNLIISKVD